MFGLMVHSLRFYTCKKWWFHGGFINYGWWFHDWLMMLSWWFSDAWYRCFYSFSDGNLIELGLERLTCTWCFGEWWLRMLWKTADHSNASSKNRPVLNRVSSLIGDFTAAVCKPRKLHLFRWLGSATNQNQHSCDVTNVQSWTVKLGLERLTCELLKLQTHCGCLISKKYPAVDAQLSSRFEQNI